MDPFPNRATLSNRHHAHLTKVKDEVKKRRQEKAEKERKRVESQVRKGCGYNKGYKRVWLQRWGMARKGCGYEPGRGVVTSNSICPFLPAPSAPGGFVAVQGGPGAGDSAAAPRVGVWVCLSAGTAAVVGRGRREVGDHINTSSRKNHTRCLTFSGMSLSW